MTTALTKTKKAQTAMLEAEKRAERAMTAYRMRREGRSWWEIAENLGITEQAAGQLVKDRLRVAAELVDEGSRFTLLALEIDRLDQLQAGIWRQAISGDLAAVDRAVKIIHERASLLGLDEATNVNVTNNTVVIAGTGTEYIEALKAYARTPLAIEE